jgi:hypothetical protein
MASELRILRGHPVLNLARALRLLGQSGEIRRCADTTENEGRDGGPALHLCVGYWIALPMLEKTVLALVRASYPNLANGGSPPARKETYVCGSTRSASPVIH